ncbi:MAG TPA: hypothetical protein VFO39_02760 [Candidatus Sulfotelmatobacter sp.]|nr:hypothetical protein [Candidatus Sulfotelmatobacter sp.]
MSFASNAKKIGVVTRAATHVAGEQARRSRTFQAVLGAGRATMQSFGHVAHQLWLEVTGTIFLFMAIVGGVALIHEYTQYEAGKAAGSRVVLAICFTLLFAWFGVSSFWRVRKKRS